MFIGIYGMPCGQRSVNVAPVQFADVEESFDFLHTLGQDRFEIDIKQT